MKINKSALVAVLLILLANVAYAKSYEAKKKIGEYNIAMRIDRNPPIAGDNHVSIEVTDTSGRCICDAHVIIEYYRPAREGMPAIDYKADTRLRRGRFIGTISLPLPGSWNIEVWIIKGRKNWITRFTIDVE